MTDSIAGFEVSSVDVYGNESQYIASFGKISGKLLGDPLIEDGIKRGDLKLVYQTLNYYDVNFKNTPTSLSLLRLFKHKTDINEYGVSINSTNTFDSLSIGGVTKAINLPISNSLQIGEATGDHVVFETPNKIYSTYGDILISSYGTVYNDNVSITNTCEISSTTINFNTNNSRIISNIIKFDGRTVIGNDITISNDLTINNNLTVNGTIHIGDNLISDTLLLGVKLNADINSEQNNTYIIGSDQLIWKQLFSQNITSSNISTSSINIDNITIENSSLYESKPNTPLIINGNSVFVENIQISNNDLHNTSFDTLVFSTASQKHYKFDGTNGIVIPNGITSEQPMSPHIGSTRWNTELQRMESFDGDLWSYSSGKGVTLQEMREMVVLFGMIF